MTYAVTGSMRALSSTGWSEMQAAPKKVRRRLAFGGPAAGPAGGPRELASGRTPQPASGGGRAAGAAGGRGGSCPTPAPLRLRPTRLGVLIAFRSVTRGPWEPVGPWSRSIPPHEQSDEDVSTCQE